MDHIITVFVLQRGACVRTVTAVTRTRVSALWASTSRGLTLRWVTRHVDRRYGG